MVNTNWFTTNGWLCARCNGWVSNHGHHFCPNPYAPYVPYVPQPRGYYCTTCGGYFYGGHYCTGPRWPNNQPFRWTNWKDFRIGDNNSG